MILIIFLLLTLFVIGVGIANGLAWYWILLSVWGAWVLVALVVYYYYFVYLPSLFTAALVSTAAKSLNEHRDPVASNVPPTGGI